MTKEKLGVDIDETIVPLLDSFLEYYNEKYGTDFSTEDFSTYNWWEEINISEEGAYKEMEEYAEEKIGVCPSAYPTVYIDLVKGAEKALDLLSRFYELHSVTHRSTSLMERTGVLSSSLYVENNEDGTYFPEIPFENLGENEGRLILPLDRVHFTEGRTKDEVCKEIGIEMIVDDDLEVARNCAAENIQTLLLEKPWNEGLENNSMITKVKGWSEACSVLLSRKFHSNFGDQTSQDYEIH